MHQEVKHSLCSAYSSCHFFLISNGMEHFQDCRAVFLIYSSGNKATHCKKTLQMNKNATKSLIRHHRKARGFQLSNPAHPTRDYHSSLQYKDSFLRPPNHSTRTSHTYRTSRRQLRRLPPMRILRRRRRRHLPRRARIAVTRTVRLRRRILSAGFLTRRNTRLLRLALAPP